ncbi:MAG: GDP-mannose 4,6-dehydratase, partial [Clostridium sp.]|nr:GDP-mannose 4,6-dehydratase [Clostridium sp.]
ELLWGDATKAERELGWERKISFKNLVSMMVDADMKEIAGLDSQEFIARNEAAATK